MFFQKLITTTLLVASSSIVVAASASKSLRNLKKDEYLVLEVCNQAFQQPFGGFFVMVHNEEAAPLFECGGQASEPLALLAENGDPGPLLEHYTNASTTGVGYAFIHSEGAPYFGGDSTNIMVPDDKDYPYVTIASMAINTNDCFVALNGAMMMPGAVLSEPGYDAGTEENNELCESIPGPACAADSGNVRSGNGEGFVHIHRGFFGVGGELGASGYDWRNPMMRVAMHEYDEDTMGETMMSGSVDEMMSSSDGWSADEVLVEVSSVDEP